MVPFAFFRLMLMGQRPNNSSQRPKIGGELVPLTGLESPGTPAPDYVTSPLQVARAALAPSYLHTDEVKE